MRDLIIIGAGGMGRTMYDLATESVGYMKDYRIKGFIDDNTHSLDSFNGYPPVISSVKDYVPEENDVFVCSIGGRIRKKCMESILSKGGKFMTMIHRTARIGSNVQIGDGNLIGAFTTVAADASIGDYNFIQSLTIIGHDVKIGSWNRIDSHVMIVGGNTIGDENMIHTGSMLNHNVSIQDRTTIGAHSFITMDVESETTYFSQPARRLK